MNVHFIPETNEIHVTSHNSIEPNTTIITHDDFAKIITDQFDQMLTLSERQPLIMGVALHTFVVGQPFRLLALQRALEHMLSHRDAGKVWFTRPGAIADHVMQLPKGIVPGS